MNFRKDIEGLRALSVISVILFHLGLMTNGFLGVDVFFVISGYLITSIIYLKLKNGRFTIRDFYIKRFRRILPLLSVTSLSSLVVGMFLMLPDDLENLCQQILASNFSLNNFLMLTTSSDYWAIKNEYKPLMHTWSLGIEEQYYLLFPLLMILGFSTIKRNRIFHVLVIATSISFLLYILQNDEGNRFYLLQYRFYEMSFGGVMALYGQKSLKTIKSGSLSTFLLLLSFLALIYLFTVSKTSILLVPLTTLCTGLLLHLNGMNKTRALRFLELGFFTFVGRLSFSLYMWHQILFAFWRYSLGEITSIADILILITSLFVVSFLSYKYVELPFRSRDVLRFRTVALFVTTVMLIASCTAYVIYSFGGVYKEYELLDVNPKLVLQEGLNTPWRTKDNINIHYNMRNFEYDIPFKEDSRLKVLVMGDSFGRDFINILREGKFTDTLQISYLDTKNWSHQNVDRFMDSDIVFLSNDKSIEDISLSFEIHSILVENKALYRIGPKKFGQNAGVFYNEYARIKDFENYVIPIDQNLMDKEHQLSLAWGDFYVSMLVPASNENGLRVFSDEGKLISQDTLHLTKGGARFYSKKLRDKLAGIFMEIQNSSKRTSIET